MVESKELILHDRSVPFEADEVRLLIFSVSEFDQVIKPLKSEHEMENEWQQVL